MRINILGTALALLAYPLATSAAAVINATAAIAATTAINATSPFPIGEWRDLNWQYIGHGINLDCQLNVIWTDNWPESGQTRYHVEATADLGKIYDILDLDDTQAAQYEKLLLEAWANYWWGACPSPSSPAPFPFPT